DLDLMRARYVSQVFSRHFHEGFAVGVIESGALGFNYMGENLVAPPGAINLAVPGEAHTGHAMDESGWLYRMFYFDVDLLQKVASEMADRPEGIPFFTSGVIHDDALARCVRRLHVSLENNAVSGMETETRILEVLGGLLLRHAADPPAVRAVGNEAGPVKRAIDYINDNYSRTISLDELSGVAHLSPFHLIRVFANETGLTPHAYVTQIRIHRAMSRLAGSHSLSRIALETGFSDQSHLTRRFKRIVGVTPGQYRNFVQDK
ncbi:MAG: AraC family transcriptional regulator, partial [Desulfobacterales bacterium]|nr:AraC family transcriptional regulator [Desulfobacterales bacterium]